ncbi:right-handed parallel beta-helix repeat-containing protein [Frondihabitans australicus]|uniref:Parallel beta-helix repeat protein n=1 Tax=Frondihabitans australicus TaxID=386892 RepID=A0A495IB76_9MICO|nr:right-handed parallel beta-helix repeat-containing protein [Frondihabitans australicus]RKR72930.1 parallel beta-helix repeat protein [Frondihabitans australicus]
MKSPAHRQRPARFRKTIAPALGLAVGVLVAAIVPSQLASATPTTVASDLFARSVSSGWGTAPTGGGWSTSKAGSARFSVSGGRGIISNLKHGNSATATLGRATAGDLDLSAVVTAPNQRAGLYTALELRTQSDGSRYRGRLTFGSTGTAVLSISRVNKKAERNLATVKLPFTVAPWASVHVEYEVTGTSPVTVRGRAWTTGTAPWWQIQTVDSSSSRIAARGHLGFWEYASASNRPVIQNAVDDFTATADPESATGPTTTSPPVVSTPPTDADPSAGAATIGTTDYAPPAGALYVSPAGDDSASGGLTSPFRTLAHAVDAAASGQTIVMRAGVYNESVTVPTSKSLTIQAYPHEAVWMDGSQAVTSWTRTAHGWTTPWSFFPSNAIDGIADNPRYVSPTDPLAARMDMAFLDGSQMTQVATATDVKAGDFYADPSGRTITIGTDPTGHDLRISNQSQALYFKSTNDTLLGIGVRRYASTAATIGAVRFENTGAKVQNVEIDDTSYIGINVSNNGGALDHVTVKRAGMLGVGVNASYGFSLTNSEIDDNNFSHFKAAPVSGGVKVTRSRGVTVSDNVFDGNDSTGFWCDESCYDVTVTGNTATDNTDDGFSIELSQKVLIADNTVTGSGADINIIDTGDVRIINNSLGSATTFAIRLAQDSRTAAQTSVPGHDPRQPNPDPTVPWLTKGVQIENNAFGTSGNGYQIYGLDMVDKQVTITGNMFNRRVTTSNPTLVAWGTSATTGDYVHVQSPEQLNQVAGVSWVNQQTDEALTLSQMTSALSAAAPSTATPLPSDIATLIGQSAGLKHIGAF